MVPEPPFPSNVMVKLGAGVMVKEEETELSIQSKTAEVLPTVLDAVSAEGAKLISELEIELIDAGKLKTSLVAPERRTVVDVATGVPSILIDVTPQSAHVVVPASAVGQVEGTSNCRKLMSKDGPVPLAAVGE